jgi:hypothetical protein
MNVKAVVEDAKLQDTLVLDYAGRIVIDAAKKEFRAADLKTDRPVDPGDIAKISPNTVRKFELSGDSFVVTYLDVSAKPTAIARWRRSQ